MFDTNLVGTAKNEDEPERTVELFLAWDARIDTVVHAAVLGRASSGNLQRMLAEATGGEFRADRD